MVVKRVPGSVGTRKLDGLLENIPGPGGIGLPDQSPIVERVGPVGIHLAPKQAIPAKSQQKIAHKKFKMPIPDVDVAGNITAMIREVDLPLFHDKGAKTKLEDVVQQGVANCALASLLAALANTAKGSAQIVRMLQETKAPTLTTYPKGKNEFMTFDGSRKIEGKRYFTVKFPGKGDVDVSSVFFTDDSDPPHINMIYMTSQSPKVLWASVIEKAYAAILGGYDQFSDDPTVVWKHVMGRAPKFLSMQSGTQNFASDRDIIRQARKAGTQPMIAAIPAKYHGETVKAVKGNKLVLYDPFEPGDEQLSMRELREYQTVFYYDDR